MADCGAAPGMSSAGFGPQSVAIQMRDRLPAGCPADDQGLRGRLAALRIVAQETARELRSLCERVAPDGEADGPEPDEAGLWRDALDRLDRAARLGLVLSERMASATHTPPAEPAGASLNAIVVAALSGAQRPDDACVVQHTNLAEGLWTVRAAPRAVERIVDTLLVRAKVAMPHGGTMTIRTENLPLGPATCGSLPKPIAARWVCLVVEDTADPGAGGPPHRIFEPFAPPGGSAAQPIPTLAELSRMVRSIGGRLTAETLPQRGASFRIYFPAQCL